MSSTGTSFAWPSYLSLSPNLSLASILTWLAGWFEVKPTCQTLFQLFCRLIATNCLAGQSKRLNDPISLLAWQQSASLLFNWPAQPTVQPMSNPSGFLIRSLAINALAQQVFMAPDLLGDTSRPGMAAEVRSSQHLPANSHLYLNYSRDR